MTGPIKNNIDSKEELIPEVVDEPVEDIPVDLGNQMDPNQSFIDQVEETIQEDHIILFAIIAIVGCTVCCIIGGFGIR